jgi:putative membrane protein
MMYDYPLTWGGMLLMMVSCLFWFGLLGLALWAILRRVGVRAPTQEPSGGPGAMEVLRQRYARGEIDDATFARMRQQLEGTMGRDAPPPPPAALPPMADER